MTGLICIIRHPLKAPVIYASLVIRTLSMEQKGIFPRWKLTRVYIPYSDPEQMISHVIDIGE